MLFGKEKQFLKENCVKLRRSNTGTKNVERMEKCGLLALKPPTLNKLPICLVQDQETNLKHELSVPMKDN